MGAHARKATVGLATQRHWHDALLFAIAVALYAPSLGYGFVGDDLIHFIGNAHIKSFDVTTILRYGAIGADYLPLRDLSFAFDYLLWGANPFWFHVTNVVLYGISVIAVKHLFVALNALLLKSNGDGAEKPAFLAAMLFALHPTHWEVVCAVHNRGGLLAALFCILSCLSYLRYMRSDGEGYVAYILALLCYIGALMSREYGIILPGILLLLAIFGGGSGRFFHIAGTSPFFFCGFFVYLIYKRYALAANYITSSATSQFLESADRIEVAAKITAFYIIRMVTYAGNFSDLFPLAAGGIIIGLLGAAISLRRRYPQVLFGVLFYLICLIPVLNLFKTDPVVAARYSYLPCLGLFFAVTAISYEGKLRIILLGCIAFTLTWFIGTMDQLNSYKDNITYWETIVRYTQTATVYKQLGYAYYDEQRYEDALEAMDKVNPVPWGDSKYHSIIGKSCFKLNNFACAVQSLKTAMTLGADDDTAALYLAKACESQGDQACANSYYDYVSRNHPQLNEELTNEKVNAR